MPKERLHLLIADEAYGILSGETASLPYDDRRRFFYLLGAISADTLFYDVPSFGMGRIGSSLHGLLESKGDLKFFRDWLREDSLPSEMQFWVLGLAAHYMTDGLWHPLINRFSNRPACVCREIGLSRRHCHHWLEAELEAFWLARLGPSEGYIPLLKLFWTEGRAGFVRCYKKLLGRAGLPAPPTKARLARCLFWQTYLFRHFTDSFWQAVRPWLLARKATRYYGTLIVPLHPSLSRPPARSAAERDALETLCDPTFMARTVTSLANHLSSLGVRI